MQISTTARRCLAEALGDCPLIGADGDMVGWQALAEAGRAERKNRAPPLADVRTPMWLATRRELRRLPHVRALYEGLCDFMQAEADWLAGRRG